MAVDQLKDAVQGKSSLVRSLGIMTSENPMGKPMKRTVNRDLVLQCKQALKRRGLEYIPVKGRYGGDENSLFVINPLLKDMMELSRQFDQEFFIFATCDDGGCDMGYYEKGQGDSPYILKHSRNHVVGMDDAEDFFTSVKARSKRAFKFQIPFFDGQDDTDISSESIVHTLEHYVIERYGYQGIGSLSERISETFSRNITERRRHSLPKSALKAHGLRPRVRRATIFLAIKFVCVIYTFVARLIPEKKNTLVFLPPTF